MAKLDGIVNQVIENLLNLSHVGVYHLDGVGKGKVEADIFLPAGTLKRGCRILDDTVDVKIGPGQVAFRIQRV